MSYLMNPQLTYRLTRIVQQPLVHLGNTYRLAVKVPLHHVTSGCMEKIDLLPSLYSLSHQFQMKSAISMIAPTIARLEGESPSRINIWSILIVSIGI